MVLARHSPVQIVLGLKLKAYLHRLSTNHFTALRVPKLSSAADASLHVANGIIAHGSLAQSLLKDSRNISSLPVPGAISAFQKETNVHNWNRFAFDVPILAGVSIQGC
jgi:hypothetical protein